MLEGREIVLGVSGGIAAYNGSMKAAAEPAMMADKPGASGGTTGGTSTRR